MFAAKGEAFCRDGVCGCVPMSPSLGDAGRAELPDALDQEDVLRDLRDSHNVRLPSE